LTFCWVIHRQEERAHALVANVFIWVRSGMEDLSATTAMGCSETIGGCVFSSLRKSWDSSLPLRMLASQNLSSTLGSHLRTRKAEQICSLLRKAKELGTMDVHHPETLHE
jgi:hypothetical protein